MIRNLSNIYFENDFEKYNSVGELAELVFDVSQGQIYLALLNGKMLDIIPIEVKKNPRELSYYLSDRKITHCDITPTLLNILNSYVDKNAIKQNYPLMWATSGEMMPLDLAIRVIKNTGTRIANSYGPAEICVYASIHILDNNNVNFYSATPIGKAINNTEICFLDESGKPVANDIEGEIAISGVGVTSGYINLSEANKKAFIILENGKRFYKTGDLGFTSSKDNLMYCLGRIDNQVKYHGIRIELDEIRSSLMTMDGISNCVAYVHKNNNGSDLVVYYISSREYTKTELYNHMRQYLPISILPNYFVRIFSIPTTVNGKLDIKLFPSYKMEDSKDKKNSTLDIEQRDFLSIVEDNLDIEDVSLMDNFFSLGGNSLDFIYFLAKIEEHLSISVSYNKLLKCDSLGDIYNYLKSCQKLIRIGLDDKQLTKVQMNQFQCDIIKAEDCNATYPTHNIVQVSSIDKQLEVNRLKKAVQETVYDFDCLRSSIIEEDGKYFLQLNAEIGDVFECHKCDSLKTAEIKRHINSFNYGSKYLIKVILLVSNDNQKLIINAHHSVFDYMSIKIFYKYMLNKYYAIPTYRPKSYFQYLVCKPKEDYEAAKSDFWKKYYENRPRAVFFPTLKKVDLFNSLFRTKEISLNEETINLMQQYGKKYSFTNFHIILAIWSLVIAEYTNENDIIIGTFFSGRKNNNFDMIGLFTSCLGVRLQIKEMMLSEDYFEYVKQQCQKLYEYQDTEIRELFRYLQFKDLMKGELFGILINYHSKLSFSEKFAGENVNVYLEDLSMEPNNYPLNISIYEYSNCIKINISYDTNKYEEDYLSAIAATFLNMTRKLIKKIRKMVQYDEKSRY